MAGFERFRVPRDEREQLLAAQGACTCDDGSPASAATSTSADGLRLRSTAAARS